MFLLTLTTIAVPAVSVSAQEMFPNALQERMVERRAVDAIILGLPLVGEYSVGWPCKFLIHGVKDLYGAKRLVRWASTYVQGAT